MTAELCPLSDLPPTQCACKRHRGEPEPVPHPRDPGDLGRSRSWPARYPSRCPDCGGQVEVGDPIIRSERGGYVHESCPD